MSFNVSPSAPRRLHFLVLNSSTGAYQAVGGEINRFLTAQFPIYNSVKITVDQNYNKQPVRRY